MSKTNIFYKTTHNNTNNNTLYRSYKYKSILENTNNTTFHSQKLQSTQKVSMSVTFRKPKSSSVRKQYTVRQKYSAGNEQELSAVQLKPAYLECFDKILSSNQKNSKQKMSVRTNRVHLPCIIDFEPSNFTSLDPLFLPIDHIQRGVRELNLQLVPPKTLMSQIHHDMINFQQKIQKQLIQTQQLGIRQFERLKKLLRCDRVINQQNNMRFKRQCLQLKKIDKQFKANFQNTKPRLDVLQDEIFSNRPFELTRNANLAQQFPQEYF